jgi:hypothetical protein
MKMTKFDVALAFGLVALAPLSAAAQTCAGVPLLHRQSVVSAGMSFPDNASGYGVAAASKLSDHFTLGANYTLTTFDSELGDVPSMNQVGLSGAYEFSTPAAAGAPSLALCPVVGATYAKWDQLDVFSVPVGAALGVAVPVADGAVTLNPYAVPQVVWSRASTDGASDSNTDFGFSAGANAIFNKFLVGGALSKVGDSDVVFGIQVGLTF